MDKEKYWKVFLKTDERYNGILYKKDFSEDDYDLVNSISLGGFSLNENSDQTIWEDNGNNLFESKISIIQVNLDNKFQKDDWSRLLITVDSEGANKLFHRPYLIQFAESKLGLMHTGMYNYTIQNINIWQNTKAKFVLYSKDKPLYVENVTLKFYSKKD